VSSSSSWDRTRPTLLFLHALFFEPGLFHWQAKDPALRECNMIFLDLRVHGKTQGDVWLGMQLEDFADDVSRFISE
jgi:pimeloyl-ACP methyl ester carboxylesterase